MDADWRSGVLLYNFRQESGKKVIEAVNLIRRRVFLEAGEDIEGKSDVKRCPGLQDCMRLRRAKGKTLEEKWAVAGIADCPGCNGNPPLELVKETEDEAAEEEEDVQAFVNEIEEILFLENGGEMTDWNAYPSEYYKAACIWRKTESEIKTLRYFRLLGEVKTNNEILKAAFSVKQNQ